MNWFIKIAVFTSICSLWVNYSLGQEVYELELTVASDYTYKTKHKDSLSLMKEVIRVNNLSIANGFISSYVRTLKIENRKYFCQIIQGKQYSWSKLRISPAIKTFLANPITFKKQISSKEIEVNIDRVLTECQNKGYPFASVQFDSIEINEGKVSAFLELSLNQFIVIDSIIIKGELKTSAVYIKRFIGIEKGEFYNENKIKSIEAKIANIPFLTTLRVSEVFFTKGKATLVLYLKDKGASRFDGIIGLNPDEVTGKIGIVGDLKINLLNAFKQGENLVLNWEQAKTNTQNYLVDFKYPFLFNSRVGIKTSLNYYRQDTSFANLKASGGFSFFLDNNQEFTVLAQLIQSNSLLNSKNETSIPTINSTSTLYYGVDYAFNSLDYRWNPRRGVLLEIGAYSGRKTITKDVSNLSEEYKELKEKSTQIKTDIEISYFFPLFKQSTLLMRAKSGNLFGSSLFLNELYQIGGLKTIRGFNQQAFLVSNYLIATAEYRYLFDRNSAVFGFFDYGFYENKSVGNFLTDTPFGFGFGANFQTGAGIFTLSYGLGKQLNNPILVKNGKVHFGFVSLF